MPQPQVAYMKGEFLPVEQCSVNVRSKAINYGLGVFEGIRAYWNAGHGELYVFRMAEHYERLRNSARICRLPFRLSAAEMGEITLDLLRRNGHRENVYVRPLLFVDQEGLSPTLPLSAEGVALTVWSQPLGDYLDGGGVTAVVSSWRRVGDNMIPARAKPTAAYLNSALARAEARDANADEAIFLTADGYVSEGSAEHLFLFLDGKLVTSTSQDDNLDGITRRTVLQLAREELGFETEVRRVSRTELYVAEEAFFVGTGAQVTPVVEIDHRPVGGGEIGLRTQGVKELYHRVVLNEVPRYAGWLTPVYGTG